MTTTTSSKVAPEGFEPCFSPGPLELRTTSRNFRSDSLTELINAAPGPVSWHAELRHILAWQVYLLPTICISVMMVISNEVLCAKLLLDSPARGYNLMVRFLAGMVQFSIALGNLYREFNLSFLKSSLSALAMLMTFPITFSIAVASGFPWRIYPTIAYISLSFGISTFLSMLVAQLFFYGKLLRISFVVATTTGLCSVTSIMVIVGYGYIASTLSHSSWVVEWFATGVAYPVISLLAGRILIADILSFILLYGFPKGSSRNVISFQSILVKVAFYMIGQIAIMFVSSMRTFVLATLVSSIAEVIGTYVNIQATRYIRQRVYTMQLTSESESVIHQWLVIRAALSSERLILHIHDESIGEKLVITCAIALSLIALHLFNIEMSVLQVCLRGIILLSAEVVQDFIQRRLLLNNSGLSVTTIEPHMLNLRENLNNVMVCLMTINFFATAQSLISL